jgi:phosphatidylglycerophosphatase A
MADRLAPGPLKQLAWMVGTGLGTGLVPFAPATAASLAALLIYIFVPLQEHGLGLYLLVSIGFPIGVWATWVLSSPSDPDPNRAVWDEFVGMWLTCLLLPKTWPWMAAAFVCFRVLDVLKPWPARRLERLPGGVGIMADDAVVGLYGAALLNVLRLGVFG